MYITELEQLVLEDENKYYNNERNANSILLKLEIDDNFKNKYLANVDLSKYTGENYNKLKSLYNKEYDKMDKLSYLSNILNYLSNKYKHINIQSDKLYNKIDSLEIRSKIKKELIDMFDKELSYLLYLDVITEEDALNRGFSPKYIKVLKNRANSEIESAYEALRENEKMPCIR